MERGAIGADPAGYDVEGAHEDGSHHGGGHAYQEGKEPQEGDGDEVAHCIEEAATAQTAEAEGEHTIEDAYVEARQGKGMGGAGMGIVGAGLGGEPLLVAQGEGSEHAELIALVEGKEVLIF